MTPIFTPRLDHNATPGPKSIVFAFREGRLVIHANSRESEPIEFHELGQSRFVTCVYLGLIGDRVLWPQPKFRGCAPTRSQDRGSSRLLFVAG